MSMVNNNYLGEYAGLCIITFSYRDLTANVAFSTSSSSFRWMSLNNQSMWSQTLNRRFMNSWPPLKNRSLIIRAIYVCKGKWFSTDSHVSRQGGWVTKSMCPDRVGGSLKLKWQGKVDGSPKVMVKGKVDG